MSRTARRPLVAALWLATLAPAFAAAPPAPSDDPPLGARSSARPGRTPPARPRLELKSVTPSEPARRRELEDLRRRDIATALGRMGVAVDWRQHPLRDLLEWRARAEAAEALRSEAHVTVDWRSQSLERLLELRLRAGRAADLHARFGVNVDWQRYSVAELDAMAKTMTRLRPRAVAAGSREPLLPPTFADHPERAARGRDPDAVIQPTFSSRVNHHANERDPDAVIRPRFAAPTVFRPDERDPDAVIRPRFAARPPAPAAGTSPDDLMSPSFSSFRRPPLDRAHRPSDPDDLIDPR